MRSRPEGDLWASLTVRKASGATHPVAGLRQGQTHPEEGLRAPLSLRSALTMLTHLKEGPRAPLTLKKAFGLHTHYEVGLMRAHSP